MIKEIQYTSIKRVLDNILDHPLLRDVTLEQAIRYTIRFIQINGFPKFYKDKIEDVEIQDYRGLLPCDLISIIQVKDKDTGICLRSMSDNFPKALEPKPIEKENLLTDAKFPDNIKRLYIPKGQRYLEEPSFKTQGRVVFTSFPKGCVEIAYKSIPVDENGFPLLIDNENYLAALEAYIKVQVFTIKFDTGKINGNVLQNAQQDYAWKAGELQSEFNSLSPSEAESFTRFWNTLILSETHFNNGFKNLSDREYRRRH